MAIALRVASIVVGARDGSGAQGGPAPTASDVRSAATGLSPLQERYRVPLLAPLEPPVGVFPRALGDVASRDQSTPSALAVVSPVSDAFGSTAYTVRAGQHIATGLPAGWPETRGALGSYQVGPDGRQYLTMQHGGVGTVVVEGSAVSLAELEALAAGVQVSWSADGFGFGVDPPPGWALRWVGTASEAEQPAPGYVLSMGVPSGTMTITVARSTPGVLLGHLATCATVERVMVRWHDAGRCRTAAGQTSRPGSTPSSPGRRSPVCWS